MYGAIGTSCMPKQPVAHPIQHGSCAWTYKIGLSSCSMWSMCWQFKQGHHCIPSNAIYQHWVQALMHILQHLFFTVGEWCLLILKFQVSPVLARLLVGGSGIGDRLVPAGYSFRKYHVVVKWVGWVYITLLLAINNNDWRWIAADILLSVFSQLIIIIIIINPNACFLATFVDISASFCFLRSTIVGGSTTLVCRRPRNVFSSWYCWVLRASHILISYGLCMSFFFHPNTLAYIGDKARTKQCHMISVSNSMGHQKSKSPRQQSCIKHTSSHWHNFFFLMDTKGVQQVGLQQQR